MPVKHREEAKSFAALLGGLLVLWVLGRLFDVRLEDIERLLQRYPLHWSGPLFVVAFVAVTSVVWFSKDLFRIAGAVAFGPAWSTLLIVLGESINALTHFLAARRFGRPWVERVLGEGHRTLDERLARTPMPWLILFRATPLIPFRFLDLAAGLTGMTLGRYLSAVAVGTPPRVFWLQFILAGVGKAILTEPTAAARYLQENPWGFWSSCGYVLLVVLVAWKLRR